MNEQIIPEYVRKKYEEAFSYVGGDIFMLNPKKAFSIFRELAEEGFVIAEFYSGLMLCLGRGVEKDINKGKEILQKQEKYTGLKTEVIFEQMGMFKELTIDEKLKCIDYWKSNHQITHALYLKLQIW